MLNPASFATGVVRAFRGPARWAWLTVLATPFLAAVYAVSPTAGPTRTYLYPMFGVLAAVIIAIAIHRRSPIRRASWVLVATGVALLAVGDIIYTGLAIALGEVPYPSLADIAYLAGYFCLGGGAFGLVRGRTGGDDWIPLIDSAILAAGVASLFWVFLVLPSISGSVDPLATTVSLAYPAMDLVLLAIGARAFLGSEQRPRYLQLFLLGVAIYFVTDVVYAVAALEGSYVDGHPVDLGWIVGVLLMASAAHHPSVGEPVSADAPAEVGLSAIRLGLLALAAMIAPGVMLLRGAAGDMEVVYALVGSWVVLFALVLLRMATTVHDLKASLSHRRSLQADLSHQATHDPLTNLANRALFETRLSEGLAADPERTAVIFLDLDDFKTINDTLGHATGDVVLQTIAHRIEHELRGGDLAARVGGDEFAVLLEGCPNVETVRRVADRILAAVRTPMTIAGRRLLTHASAGITIGDAGENGLEMMRDADVAMYRAKSNGKDQVGHHEPALHEAVVRSYALRTDLAAAIDAGEFVVEYQPILHLESDILSGAEALVRWQHPIFGLIRPDEFIGIAESSGHIHALGRWILGEACRAAASWPLAPDGHPRTVSVNVAPTQLVRPGLVEEVADVLAETGLAPERLIIEITESALDDLKVARTALVRLRALGVRLAMDDFGTGYSALSYLAELPFDIVKIDRSFIVAMEDNQRVDALLEGILRLCRSLKLRTVAEGIETAPQLERLRTLDCSYAQGYLVARPMPGPSIATLFAEVGLQGAEPRRRPIREIAVAV